MVETTTITQGVYNMVFNLSGLGDFHVHDGGVSKFEVNSVGTTTFGGDTYWRDASTTGTTIARLYDSGDDGVFQVYRNGAIQHNINSIGASVFNEQGLSNDFRIETDTQYDMFFVDGSADRIGINTVTPANQFQFIADGSSGWVTQWLNSYSVGALKQVYNDNVSNISRVFMGITNVSGSGNLTPGVMGLSMNVTTTGSSGIGVQGSANNESGMAVYGSLFHVGSYNGWAGYFDSDVYTAGTYFGSDRKLKRDIAPINSALGIINQLDPVSYYYDTETYPEMGLDEDRLTYGFIAQDLELVLPELVKEKNLILNSNTIKSADKQSAPIKKENFKVVNYTLMIPVLTQAIKEQQQIINDLSEQLNNTGIVNSSLLESRIVASETGRMDSELYLASPSTKGLMFGVCEHNEEGEQIIRTEGIVFIDVDSSNGSIESGDFITVSSNGKALKSTNPEWVIGKALEGQIDGKVKVRIDFRFKQ